MGLRFCARAFSSCGKRGPLFIAVHGPLTIAAPLVAEHRLQTRRLSNCGSRAHLLRGMWDLPRPGLEPVSPALAGRLPTTAPPGKPHTWKLDSTDSAALQHRLADCRLADPYSALFVSHISPWLLGRLNVLRNSAKVWSLGSIDIWLREGKKKGTGIVIPKTLIAKVGRGKETKETWKERKRQILSEG